VAKTLVLALPFLLPGRAQAKELQRWELKESLGHHWKNELVFFPLGFDGGVPKEAEWSVVDEKGQAFPFQFWRREGLPLALLVDLPPYTSRSFALTNDPNTAEPPADLKVTQDRGCYVLSAGRSAVRVARAEDFRPGTPFRSLPAPIQAIKGVSGRWLGEGTLLGDFPVTEFTTQLTATGPLFAEAKVKYQFGPRKFYQLSVRVISGEDVALVEEDVALSEEELKAVTFVVPPDLAPEIGTASPLTDWLVNKGMGWIDVAADVTEYPCFRFNFFKNWEADRVRGYALGGATVFERKSLADASSDWRTGLVLTPYQARGRRLAAAGFDARENAKDYLGIFYRHLGRWRHPNENRVPMPWLDDGVTAHFLAFEGRREWGLMVTEPGEQNDDTSAKHGRSEFAAIRAVQAKHGETPLDKVKDWSLEWDLPANAHYPRLYYSPESVARMKSALPKLPGALQEMLKRDTHATALLTGDAAGLQRAFQDGTVSLRVCVDAFLRGGQNTIDTYTHRFQEIVRSAAPTLDIGLACETVPPEEKKRSLAIAAFLAQKISDPDYWACRAYGGGPSNPNMMSIATNALAMCAALCPGHPRQPEWLKLCERLVCADILMSISPDGAWLESPGYQGAGNTPINMTVLILKNAGAADLVKHPVFGQRLLAVSRYMANLLTPPDPRFEGKRMPMSLGDGVPFFNNMQTYLAWSGKDSFPGEAGNAVWCWEQMGRPAHHELLMLLHEHVMDGAIPPVPISGKSVEIAGFGAVLRHGFGSPHETFMTFRQNDFGYGHYDDDQGSFSLFAKGAPLCLDWMDYSPGEVEYHNRVNYHADILPWLVPPPDALVLHDEADYVRSHEAGLPKGVQTRSMPKDAKPDWQRQILFVKDTKDPGDATYLVFRDKVSTDRPSEWNVWTMAKKGSEEVGTAMARFEGQFGVDVTFFFYLKPPQPLTTTFLRHETKSYLQMGQEQTRIQAGSPKGGDYGVVLYPLRRGVDKEPTMKGLESGAVELKWPSGRRHLIFLFPEPREAKEADISFSGRAGVVKFEDGKPLLVPLECDILK
jgi:hypothetical protein